MQTYFQLHRQLATGNTQVPMAAPPGFESESGATYPPIHPVSNRSSWRAEKRRSEKRKSGRWWSR